MNYKKSNKLLPSSYNQSKDRTSISLYSRSARITNLRLKENYKMPIVKDQHLLITYRGRKQNKYVDPQSKYLSSSCECNSCGLQGLKMKKLLNLFPFKETNYAKRKRLFKKFRIYGHAIQFIIRYQIVQKIRHRQKSKMKKAFKNSVENKMNAQALIQAAKKQIELEREQEQQQEKKQQLHDSDDEFYQLKEKQRKNSILYIRKPQQSNANLLYFFLKPSRQVMKYVDLRCPSKSQNQSPHSLLPPIQNFSHRKSVNKSGFLSDQKHRVH
ncbi:hypothetical protein pb186bvf_006158 [Paramecium bursaria]